MKFALATANAGKIREITGILSGTDAEIVTRKDLGIDIEIEETGSTFYENALLKARAICEASGLPSIADDSGLMADALDGAPGVYSSSFGGAGLSDGERCAYLVNSLRDKEHRGAKFVCTIVCAFPDGRIISARGECAGRIIDTPRGSNGFGYDPVFLVDGSDRTMAELSSAEKNLISHRGKALMKFAALLPPETGIKF